MSHFAQIDDNNVVTNVIVAEQDFIDSGVLGDPSKWIQTSYNTRLGIHYDENGVPSADQSKAFRKNYAGIGFIWHPDIDAFVAPNEYPSWTLDDSFDWQPPTARPDDDKMYNWNEDTLAWDEI